MIESTVNRNMREMNLQLDQGPILLGVLADQLGFSRGLDWQGHRVDPNVSAVTPRTWTKKAMAFAAESPTLASRVIGDGSRRTLLGLRLEFLQLLLR